MNSFIVLIGLLLLVAVIGAALGLANILINIPGAIHTYFMFRKELKNPDSKYHKIKSEKGFFLAVDLFAAEVKVKAESDALDIEKEIALMEKELERKKEEHKKLLEEE